MSENTQLAERPQSVKEYLALPAYKARFGEVLGARAPQFMASLITLTNDPNLAKCDPKSVIASAMIAAVLDFPIEKSLGFAHIVGYGGVAQFQMAAKGYVQLALRSGQYQRLNAKAVNAEAFGGYDEVGEPRIDWGQLDETKPIIGYVVAWRLNNGFTKVAYWPKAKVENHAAQFSQAYKARKMNSPWFTSFDKMALKTVVMNELRAWGVLSVQMQTAMRHDMGAQKDVEAEVEYVDSTVTEDTPATDAGAVVEQPAAQRPPPKERSKKGAAAVAENPPQSKTGATGGAVIDVQAEPPADDGAGAKLAADLAAKEAADKAKMAADQASAAPAAPVSRAFLKDAEILTCICEVVEVFPELMSRAGVTSPGVQANVKGGYVGSVIDFGGASGTDPDNLTPDPLWVPGNKLELTLQGKLGKKSGKVQASVTGKKLVEASRVSPVNEVE